MWHSGASSLHFSGQGGFVGIDTHGERSNSALGGAMGVFISEQFLVPFPQAQAKQCTRQRRSANTPLSIAVSSNTQHKNCLVILNAILPFLQFSQQSNDQAYVFERSAFPTNPCSLKSRLTTSLTIQVGRSTYLLVASVVAQNCTARSAGILKKARIRRVPFLREARNWRALSLRLVAGRMELGFLSDVPVSGRVGAICALVSWFCFERYLAGNDDVFVISCDPSAKLISVK
jgi:hypothetical protein